MKLNFIALFISLALIAGGDQRNVCDTSDKNQTDVLNWLRIRFWRQVQKGDGQCIKTLEWINMSKEKNQTLESILRRGLYSAMSN